MNEPNTTTPLRIVPPPAVSSAPSPAPQTPTTIPQQPQPSTTPPPTNIPKPNTIYLIIAGLLCLGILITTLLYLRTSSKPKDMPIVTIPPTIETTPTPPSNISRIASTSAFASYSQEIASFSAILDSFTLQDSTLAPPIMDTDLNISN